MIHRVHHALEVRLGSRFRLAEVLFARNEIARRPDRCREMPIGVDGAPYLDRRQKHEQQKRRKQSEFHGRGTVAMAREADAKRGHAPCRGADRSKHGFLTPTHHLYGSLLNAVAAWMIAGPDPSPLPSCRNWNSWASSHL